MLITIMIENSLFAFENLDEAKVPQSVLPKHVPNATNKTYTWQAEDRSIVGMWTNGASTKIIDDAEADGGSWLLFEAETPGAFIEFTLPDVLPGRYTLEIRYKSAAQRGSWQIEVGNADGSVRQVLTEAFDMRGKGFTTASVGVWSVEKMGFRTVRLTVAKAHAGAAKLSIDSFRLVPSFSKVLDVPTSLRVDAITANHCILHWSKVRNAHGYLIFRRGGKTDEWRVVGTPPANAQSFTAVGLCDETEYQFSISAFSPELRSAWSGPVTVQTPAGDHQRRGSVLARSLGRIGGASIIDEEASVQRIYIWGGTHLEESGIFEYSRSLDTPALSKYLRSSRPKEK